jgi:hypothetical protein
LLSSPAPRAADADEVPEYYFTRLVYTQNPQARRRGGNTTLAKPDPLICPEFGGATAYFPRQGFGWATDYPGGDCKYMGGVHRLTGIRVSPNPHVMEILDDDLFKFPYIYAVEVGQMLLSDKEGERLREYMLRGGFLHVDDFWGPAEAADFVDQVEKIFPDRLYQLEKPLPITHEIFHTFFDVDEVIQVPGRRSRGSCGEGGRTWEDDRDTEPKVLGISEDDGRLMMLITYNSDLGDAWEYMDDPCYPEKYSSYAYKIGINAMIYAMSH